MKNRAHLTNIIIEYVNKKKYQYSQSSPIQISPIEGGCRPDPEKNRHPNRETRLETNQPSPPTEQSKIKPKDTRNSVASAAI